MIEIKVDKRLQNLADTLLSSEQYTRACVTAGRRGLTAVRTALSVAIRQRYRNIKATDIKSSMKHTVANVGYGGEIKISGPRLPLEKFKAVKPKRGRVKTAVKKETSPKPVSRLFFNQRTGKLYRRKGKERFPFVRSTGPALAQMASNQEIIDYVQKRGQEVCIRTLEHEIERRLNK